MTIYIFSVVNLLNIGNIHGSLITYISTNHVTKSRDLIGCVTPQECANESYCALIRKNTHFFLLSANAFNVKSQACIGAYVWSLVRVRPSAGKKFVKHCFDAIHQAWIYLSCKCIECSHVFCHPFMQGGSTLI